MAAPLVVLGTMLAVGVAPAAAGAAALHGPAPTAAAGAGRQPGAHRAAKAQCGGPVRRGAVRCSSWRRTDTVPVLESRLAAGANPDGYGPADLSSMYSLPNEVGFPTVAIVDAFNDPNAESDQAIYRYQYGLPACSASSGCLKIVNQNGAASPLPTTNSSAWAGEISLDLDMVAAICPYCHVILLEADSNRLGDLSTAEDSAAAMGAKAISNSWIGAEFNGESGYDSHFNHPGVAVTAASGDYGYGTGYPAVSPYVTAVGGTSVSRTTSGTWSHTAWSGSGSGCSLYEAKPSWQNTVDTGCANRAETDVSAVADPYTGVAVYQTYVDSTQAAGWQVYGGTSAAAPIIAAISALAGSGGLDDYRVSYPYTNSGGITDVTSGSNGSCGTQLCNAGTGWDGPTGLGTPHGGTSFSLNVHAGTSPAIAALAGGYEHTAYQGFNGDLWGTDPWATADWGDPMALWTSPSITALPSNGFMIAFQGANGHLETNGTYGYGDWGLSMAAHSSPSISALGNGGYLVAFQGANGDLWTAGSWGTADWGRPMAPGSSPAITVMSNGSDYVIAYEADTGHLWTAGSYGFTDTGLSVLAGTSISMSAVTLGRYLIAFHGSNGDLWTAGSYGDADWGRPLASLSSPSITTLSNGTDYMIAYQADTGHLWTAGSYGIGDWGYAMDSPSSPAITALAGGDYRLAINTATFNRLWAPGNWGP